MATYYWVGGSGTWDNATTTNWSATSGGAGGAGFPTAADDVVFDVNSVPLFGLGTVTITAFVNCKSFLATSAASVRFTTPGSGRLRAAGSFQLLTNPFGATFDVFLVIAPATTSGVVLNSVAGFSLGLAIYDAGGLATIVTLDSDITALSVNLWAGLVPSGNFAINCEDFDLTDTPAVKVLGSPSHQLSINMQPVSPTIGTSYFNDNWDNANDQIINTTVNLTPNANQCFLESTTSDSNAGKKINFNIVGGVTRIDIYGPIIQNLTITDAEVRLYSNPYVFGVFSINGASTVTSYNGAFSPFGFILSKRAGSPNVSRSLVVPSTSQWLNVGFENLVAAGTDTISISGNFGTITNPLYEFRTGAASVGAGTIYAWDISLSTGTTLSSTVFYSTVFFGIDSGASITGTFTVNTESAYVNTYGALIPNLNISGTNPFSLASLGSNLVVTNLSITTVLGGGGGGLLVRDGSSITVTGTFILAGASASDIVDLRAYDLYGTPPEAWTIVKASGTVDASFARINYSGASGGATFNAYETNGCVDGGNNTGWNFSQPSGFFLFL